MTKQEIFDAVATHLLTQNKKSETVYFYHTHCVYRGPNGLKCAIGALIKDEHYNSKLEGLAPYALDVEQALRNSGVIQEGDNNFSLGFLKDLQMIHDDKPVEAWPENLTKLAEKYGVSSSVINKT